MGVFRAFALVITTHTFGRGRDDKTEIGIDHDIGAGAQPDRRFGDAGQGRNGEGPGEDDRMRGLAGAPQHERLQMAAVERKQLARCKRIGDDD